MAQYKVPQNVETEDKILGPLTIKQFIYVIIAVAWGFIMWRLFSAALPIAVLLIAPVSGVFLALGLIQREGQSFENYFVAMVRFLFVPRQLLWLKEPESHQVIRAPKRKTDNTPIQRRSPDEIRGALKKLATVIDTHGQFQKGDNLQLADDQNQAAEISRRINAPRSESLEQHINAMAQASDDILDPNSARAGSVGHLLQNVEQDVRAQARAEMEKGLKHSDNSANTVEMSSQSTSHNQAQNDILKMAMQSGNISVQQLASQANRRMTLDEGQAVKISR